MLQQNDMVSYTKAIVDYLCPDSVSICHKMASYPDQVTDDKIPLYWGLLGIAISVGANAVVGSGYGGFNF